MNIKPSNILINSNNEFIVSDIGFPSKKLDKSDYYAPEVIRYDIFTENILKNPEFAAIPNYFKADMFSLGMTIAEMITLKNINELQVLKLED